jgi:type I restriction enzyme S subunit
MPEDWRIAELGTVAEVRYGLGQPPEQDERGVPMIRATNVKRGQISIEGLIRIKREAIPEARNPYLRCGDIIVVRSGAYTGDVAMITSEWEGCVAGYDLVVSPYASVDPSFLSFYLLSDAVQRYFRSQRDRSAQPHLNRQQLEDASLLMPPIAEQRAIAHVLRTVQRAKETTEKVIAAARQLMQSLMRHLFTYGPVPVIEADAVVQQETQLGPFPENWHSSTLGELTDINSGTIQTGPFGSQLHRNDYLDAGIPVVNPTHLAGDRINHDSLPVISRTKADVLARHRLRLGDILFARRGEIGRHGLVTQAEENWICGTGCFIVRVDHPRVFNPFLAQYFSLGVIVEWLESNAAGSIMPNLNNATMARLPILYPAAQDQRMIVEQLSSVEKKLEAEEARKISIDIFFKSILQGLMTGQIRLPGFVSGKA